MQGSCGLEDGRSCLSSCHQRGSRRGQRYEIGRPSGLYFWIGIMITSGQSRNLTMIHGRSHGQSCRWGKRRRSRRTRIPATKATTRVPARRRRHCVIGFLLGARAARAWLLG
ncbi:unnamed protein product [Symbiodinium necroappetens]|uniref:Uncharacterized protein n=1 Tax=Symbiodinium necroappetens TaxID=1628268 RepID=A0A813A6P2_9DINO|nr:unnamed protein product [Symbiodinium necroappetens]